MISIFQPIGGQCSQVSAIHYAIAIGRWSNVIRRFVLPPVLSKCSEILEVHYATTVEVPVQANKIDTPNIPPDGRVISGDAGTYLLAVETIPSHCRIHRVGIGLEAVKGVYSFAVSLRVGDNPAICFCADGRTGDGITVGIKDASADHLAITGACDVDVVNKSYHSGICYSQTSAS